MSTTRPECIACRWPRTQPVLRIPAAPVLCNQLCHSKEAGLEAPTAPIDLVSCSRCGHLFNAAFDAGLIDYGPDYENSLHFSPRFREYTDQLVGDLERRHALQSKTVVEIGCGKGDFLAALCTTAGCEGVGYDPGCSDEAADGPVRFSSGSYFDDDGAPAPDLLCCRHVLEHVERPKEFLASIAHQLRGSDRAALYLEVPNALYTLRDLGIWDIIYEHPSYFCAESLRRVVRDAGFNSIELSEVYESQFLALHARVGGLPVQDEGDGQAVNEATDAIHRFAEAYEAKVRAWRSRIAGAASAGKRIAVWGAGSKGNSFLNVVAPGAAVCFVVDVNPSKQNRFVAGTGHRIVAPADLRESPVDMVVLMNPVYEEEVRGALDSVSPGAQVLIA